MLLSQQCTAGVLLIRVHVVMVLVHGAMVLVPFYISLHNAPGDQPISLENGSTCFKLHAAVS